MASKLELKNFIKFSLNNLKSSNQHHNFENLAFQFAKQRICSNVIPATGPVSAGGDHGRDFETYKTYLKSTPIVGSTLISLQQNKLIVFGCSLQKNIVPKIKSDLETMFKPAGCKIEAVYYFCSEDVPIGQRHKLQDFARLTYNVTLTIFDGDALAEALTDVELYALAQEYLNVSLEMFPSAPSLPRYEEYRNKWIINKTIPLTFEDFFQIKYGIRRATFEKNERKDILQWIKCMEDFLNNDLIRWNAIYEIAVASLRGINMLSSKKNLVEEYFSNIKRMKGKSSLEDTVSLFLYCNGAYEQSLFEIEPEKLKEWKEALISEIETELQINCSSHKSAYLCMLRGQLAIIESKHLNKKNKWDSVFKWWNRVIFYAKKNQLFPIEKFYDVLIVLTPVLGEEKKFHDIRNKLIELMSSRGSSRLIAEKNYEMAIQYLQSNKTIKAIKLLHTCKFEWFSAETIQNSIKILLLISECYERLGLIFAAKYYSAAAIHIIDRDINDQEKKLLTSAYIRLAHCHYVGGEWLNYIFLIEAVLLARIHYGGANSDIDEEEIKPLLEQVGIVLILAKISSLPLYEAIINFITPWPVSEEYKASLANFSIDELAWSLEEFWSNAQKNLHGRPFNDIGTKKIIEWRALGILWRVEFNNEYAITVMVEELIGILQITLADIASIEEDLCLLPTTTKMVCVYSEEGNFEIKEVLDAQGMAYYIHLSNLNPGVAGKDISEKLLSFAIAIVNKCSLLPQDAFIKIIKSILKENLFSKIFIAQSYSNFYANVILPEKIFNKIDRKTYTFLSDDKPFLVAENIELNWNSNLGTGFSIKAAERDIKSRYQKAIRPIILTLPRLLTDIDFSNKIKILKEEGYLDWQILLIITNITLKYRMNKVGTSIKETESTIDNITNELETIDSIFVPCDIYSHENFEIAKGAVLAAIAKTWGLSPAKISIFTYAELKYFLDIKYQNNMIDIKHPVIF